MLCHGQAASSTRTQDGGGRWPRLPTPGLAVSPAFPAPSGSSGRCSFQEQETCEPTHDRSRVHNFRPEKPRGPEPRRDVGGLRLAGLRSGPQTEAALQIPERGRGPGQPLPPGGRSRSGRACRQSPQKRPSSGPCRGHQRGMGPSGWAGVFRQPGSLVTRPLPSALGAPKQEDRTGAGLRNPDTGKGGQAVRQDVWVRVWIRTNSALLS